MDNYSAAENLIQGRYLIAMYVIIILLCILCIAAMWKIFVKAGEKGWKALIPFYDSYILCKITWRKGIYFLFMLIPIVNIVFGIMTYHKLSKAFGYGIAFTLGLIFLPLIFLVILAFGNSEYTAICDLPVA